MVKVEIELCGRTLRYTPLVARTPDGVSVSIQVHDGGAAGGRDVLLIHGFSQCGLAWLKQVTGPLAARHRLVTYDLRGHGASDKPLDPACYRDPERWADEVAAVMAVAGLDRPVIVCWSYGGRVALDYLRSRGDAAIAGLVKVASTSTVRPDVLGPAAPGLRDLALAGDAAANARAVAALLDMCTAEPLPRDEHALMFGYNMLVPPAVRLAMGGRAADYDAALSRLRVPVMAIHGALDRINLVGMSRHTSAVAPGAALHVYDRSGHMPFWEESERFDADLGAFLDGLPPGTARTVAER